MEYEPLFALPTGHEDIDAVFRTGRGSTYAFHNNNTTTRNRSSAQHKDKTSGLQPRSGKTVFLSESDVNRLGGFFQNPDMATQLLPELDANGKPTGKVQLKLLEDYGPRKAGTVLATAPYELKPKAGLAPMEIYNSISGMGDAGGGVHFGNKITEVHPRPARLAGKVGIAAALASGAGAASAGDFRQAAGDIAESFLPLGATPSPLAAGTIAPDERARQDAAYAKLLEQQRQQVRMTGRYDPKAPIDMPSDYRAGGRVRMI